MKKYATWLMATATIGIGIWVGSSFVTISSASSQLGSADDPVVTKSYVDQQIQKALGGSSSSSTGNTNNSNSGTKNNTPTTPVTPPVSTAPTTTPSATSSSTITTKVVEIRPGKKLIAAAGTEVIIRKGKAVVYSSEKNGILDLTAGSEMGGSQAIPNNHLLLFPRDGRGVEVALTQGYNATVLVIGDYKIQ
ncbi:hypothetical protein QE450_003397 [Paenibacillus sp. SORGH_AS306]|uniref:hypothetical protein n=1 Tax=unclassified Paenibacillus TaxID=185978 RepID=UPI0027846D61|nr:MULTISPECIES: hypothetical protein [unclassified Paenibacillus]MDQ1235899.1 hypothetical protein [Paenibacillus sp. SORGH_AS_0306]MDR6112949.1 hypothetical protein [Paenibacillus sp. SORGH_AS_0338]